MGEVRLAKHAGFCFGVKRAVQAVEECLKEGRVYTYGEIIHNSIVVEELRRRGAIPVDTLDLPAGSTLIIRSHGVPPEVYEECEKKKIRIVDATCPFVKRIHETVNKYKKQGDKIVIVGQWDHPEVVGIRGWCGEAVVLNSVEEAQCFAKEEPAGTPVCMVAQTTIVSKLFQDIDAVLRRHFHQFRSINTICSTTAARQNEAVELAKTSDQVIVIGGRNSSNTQKLAQICAKYCKNVIMIENPRDHLLENAGKNGIISSIVAGASTPDWIIREVVAKMTEFENVNSEALQEEQTAEQEQPVVEETAAAETAESAEVELKEEPEAQKEEDESAAEAEQSFADAFEKTLNRIHNGQIIKGTVVQISNGEVCVNIGYKSDGFIPKNEFSADPDVNPEEVVKVGDEIEVSVVKVNDGEGNVLLSKKAVDSRKAWESMAEDMKNGTVFETTVADVVKGGLIAYINGVQAFIPASHASNHYIEKLDTLKGQPIRVAIIEIDKNKRRIIASAKNVLKAEAEAKKKEILDGLEVGQRVKGIARRITDFGVFVDIGGIDGLLHVTDISWSRVKHPSDVVKVGDELELVILAVDKEKERISLGLKQTQPHPWETAAERYTVGSVIEGKVVRIGSFGAFVALEPGIDGLVHISQVAPKHVEKVEDELSVGDVIKVKVLSVDPEKRRIGLSRKAVIMDERKAEAPKKEVRVDENGDHYVLPPIQHNTTTLADIFPDISDIIGDVSDDEDKE